MKDLETIQAQASPETGRAFAVFCQLIAALRQPGGCPWDAEQTHASIASNMIEEACEAVEAIEADDAVHLREELGDVLLEVVLQAQIAEDAGEFTIDEVVEGINAKIVRRHPHVFGAEVSLGAAGFSQEEIAEATTSGAVLDMWEHIKTRERAVKEQQRRDKALADGRDPDAPAGLLDDVPHSLPALQQAAKISKRAVSAGFEWDSTEAVWAQVDEERAEFLQAADAKAAEEEFGDILFSLVNVARRQHIDAEAALRASCNKFRARWSIMERRARQEYGVALEELPRETQEELWNVAKEELKGSQQ